MYLVSHIEYLLQGEHILFLISKQTFDSVTIHAVHLVNLFCLLGCHFSQSLENSELAVVIIVKIVLLGQGFKGLEGIDDLSIVFGKDVVGSK